jgi:glycosyltransferase involved in cell wall biosynthesis
MYRGCTVAVVVPAYNESGFVGEVIETVPAFVDRVYAVDDCSTDGTWAEMREAATRVNEREQMVTDGRGEANEVSRPSPDDRDDADGGDAGSAAAGTVEAATADAESGAAGTGAAGETAAGDARVATRARAAQRGAAEPPTFDPRVVPMRHEENRGVGAAITTGYRQALADGIDVTAVMNGDGQMDPDILDRIIDPVVEGRADYAKGDRLSFPAYREGMSGWRLFGNVVLTFLTKVASGYWKMTDPQNGYTAVSLEALEALDLEAAHETYGFCNDVLVRLNVTDFRIADVPMQAVYGEETSHINYSTFIPVVSMLLLGGFVRRLRDKHLVVDFHPMVFLYALGAFGAAGALAFAGWAVAVAATAASGNALLSAGFAVTTALLGGLLLTLAMVFDMRHNAEMEVHA